MKRNYKDVYYHHESITVSSGAVAGSENTASFNLPSHYKKCVGVGIAIHEGSAQAFRVGLKDNNGQVIDTIPFTALDMSKFTGPDDQFVQTTILAGGRKHTLQVIPVITLTADVTLDMVFKLVNEEED